LLDIDIHARDTQVGTTDLRDREEEHSQGSFPVPRWLSRLITIKGILERFAPVNTTFQARTEPPPSPPQSTSVLFLPLNREGRDVLYSRPMLRHEKGDIARATRAIRTAYDDLQASRASRHLQFQSSLPHIAKALNNLCAKLNVITDSIEALSIFCGCTLEQESNFVETPLSDAIVQDMEATATYFRAMKSVGITMIPAALRNQEYRNIKNMVDRYETAVSTILSKHIECVRDESTRCMWLLLIHTMSRLSSLTAQSRELQEGVDMIKRRQEEQQESALADMRTSESLSGPVNVELALTLSQRDL
jgi:hypothetical protein